MSADLARELYEAVKRRGELHRAATAANTDREVADEIWFEIAKARDVAHAEVRRIEEVIEDATAAPQAKRSNPMSAIQLGDKVQDQITGFEGVVTGQCVYISGCDQILIAGRVKADGSSAESHWFDIDRCVLIEAGAIKLESVSSAARPGCDAPAPVK